MKVIAKKRGWGKTTALVEMMLENDDLLFVAPTSKQAEVGYKYAARVNPDIDRNRFKKVGSWLENNDKPFVIDEFAGVPFEILSDLTVAVSFTKRKLEWK